MAFAPPVAENRCRFRVVSSASYRYAQPARRVATSLRLIPPDERGRQRLLSRHLHVAPLPYATQEHEDEAGNRVIELRHERIEHDLTLVAELIVETSCWYDEAGGILPVPLPAQNPDSQQKRYRTPTKRTTASPDLEITAQRLREERAEHQDPRAFVAHVCGMVHREMKFASGATHVGTVAAEAWSGRRGVCQDYSHISLTLLRACGIPARYVSGFVPGEGVMHAWIEALLPHSPAITGEAGECLEEADWYAFDPTYGRWVNERYVAAAVGRDYADATPTSGTYFGGASSLRYGTRVETQDKSLSLL